MAERNPWAGANKLMAEYSRRSWWRNILMVAGVSLVLFLTAILSPVLFLGGLGIGLYRRWFGKGKTNG